MIELHQNLSERKTLQHINKSNKNSKEGVHKNTEVKNCSAQQISEHQSWNNKRVNTEDIPCIRQKDSVKNRQLNCHQKGVK